MDNIFIRVYVYSGSTISGVAEELVELADKLDIYVSCVFNDVLMKAYPGDNAKDIENYYWKAKNDK